MTELEMVKKELTVTVTDDVIQYYIDKHRKMAEEITGFKNLPSRLVVYVISATVEACNRRGNEGVTSENAFGDSTAFVYKDIEESLRKKLKHSKSINKLLGIS